MSVAALMMALVETLVGQLATQYLGALLRSLLDFIPGHALIAANGGVSEVPVTVLNGAPQELKEYTTNLLQKLVANGGLPLYAKIILNQVIKFLPEIEDSLWNMLFSKNVVANAVPEKIKTTAVVEIATVSNELLAHCKM